MNEGRGEAYLTGQVLLFGAQVFRPLPAAGGKVENGGSSHVGSLSIMGVVITAGGGGGGRSILHIAPRQAATGGRGLGEWFGCWAERDRFTSLLHFLSTFILHSVLYQ